MPDLDTVVTALATRVATVASLAGRTFPYGKDSVDPPCAIVVPSSGDFWVPDDSYDGTDEYTIIVKLIVGGQDDRTGQALLDSYLTRSGANSVYAAVYAAALGSGIDSVRLVSARAYGEVEWASVVYYGAELVYQVLT